MGPDIRSLAPTAVMFTVFGGVMLYSIIYTCYRLYKNYDKHEGSTSPTSYLPPTHWFSYSHSLTSTVHPYTSNSIQPQSYPMIIIDPDPPPNYWQLCPRVETGQQKTQSSIEKWVDPESPPPSYEEAIVFSVQQQMKAPNPVKISSPITCVECVRSKSVNLS